MYFTTILLGAALSAHALAAPTSTTTSLVESETPITNLTGFVPMTKINKRGKPKFDAYGWIGSYNKSDCSDDKPVAINQLERPEFGGDNDCHMFKQDTQYVGAWFSTGSHLTRAITLFTDKNCQVDGDVKCPNDKNANCFRRDMSVAYQSYLIPMNQDCTLF